MVQGVFFLLAVAAEGIVAAVFGNWLASRLGLTRRSAALRCLAAAVVGSGATQPVVWLELSRLVELAGSRWGGLASALGLVILIETLVYAAALRGHWRLSLLMSAFANTVSTVVALGLNWYSATGPAA